MGHKLLPLEVLRKSSPDSEIERAADELTGEFWLADQTTVVLDVEEENQIEKV